MRMLTALVAAGLQLSVMARPPAVSEERLAGHVPAAVRALNLKPLGSLPGSQRISLSIGLLLRNRGELEELLKRTYDPATPDYHHYLTPAQFTDRFGPKEEDYQAVVAFTRTNGLAVASLDPGRILVHLTATVADIERVFRLKLRLYQHPTESRPFFAPDAEPWVGGLPILHITGLDNFVIPHPSSLGKARSEGASPDAGSGPGGNLTGYDFRAAYAPGVSQTGAGQTVGLFELDGYYANDIAAYESQAGLPAVPLVNVSVDGFDMAPSTNTSHVLEVSMDIEMVISMAPGLAEVLVYEAPNGQAAANDVLARIAADNLAQQISCSWELNADATTLQYLKQMAAQGQSFFQASADGGAYVRGIDLRYGREPNGDIPYLTSVGGTTLTTSGPGGFWLSETVWNDYTSGQGTNASGGGISTNYMIPYWQTNTSMASNGGSIFMRNSPDVAMPAHNIWVIYNGGGSASSGGTSAAAPLWAGFTALVNETAAANGFQRVGFLNPALYRAGNENYGAFYHDITTGNNTNMASPNLFHAIPGYDLCTGWGSPKGMNLIRRLVFTNDHLSVSPGTDFSLGGAASGPFNPTNQTFLLQNTGASSLSWSAASESAWLTVSPSEGILAAGVATNVTASLAPVATNLVEGSYSGNIVFRNDTVGSDRLRAFTLQVGLLPATFDDLGGKGNRRVPPGYAGLDWSNFYFLNAVETTASPSGYQNGMISPPNIIYNGGGNSASMIGVTPFDLLSAYVTAAWRDGLTLQVTGSAGGVANFTITTNLSTTTPTLVRFSFFGVDRVDFETSGGTTNSTYAESGHQFAMDNVLVVSDLPPSSPLLLRASGLSRGAVGLGWTAHMGQTYQIQYATTPSPPNWAALGLPITATNVLLNATDSFPSRQRFYRLLLFP